MTYGRMAEAVKTIKEELSKLKQDLEKTNAAEDNASTLPKEIMRREKRLATIQRAKQALEAEAHLAGQNEVDAKAQKSFNDLEAQPSTRSNGNFMYSYNCQAAVDADNQIIVAAEVHDSSHDATALSPVLDAVERNCQNSADEVLADSAYNSYSNLKTTSDKGSEAFFATGKGETETVKKAIDTLKYYRKLDQFRCQGGKNLRSITKRATGKRGLMMPKSNCRGCSMKNSCHVYHRAAKTFWIPDAELFVLAREHRKRMRDAHGKAVYARRKVIVEPVFGNLKNKGIRILRKGRGKASTWWKIACTAHNIEKIVRHR